MIPSGTYAPNDFYQQVRSAIGIPSGETYEPDYNFKPQGYRQTKKIIGTCTVMVNNQEYTTTDGGYLTLINVGASAPFGIVVCAFNSSLASISNSATSNVINSAVNGSNAFKNFGYYITYAAGIPAASYGANSYKNYPITLKQPLYFA